MVLYLVVVVRGGRGGRRVHAGRVVADRGSATGGGALAPRRAELRDGGVIVLQTCGHHPRGHHGTVLHRAHFHAGVVVRWLPGNRPLSTAATLPASPWSPSSSPWWLYSKLGPDLRPSVSLSRKSQLRPCRTPRPGAVPRLITQPIPRDSITGRTHPHNTLSSRTRSL